MSTDSGPWRGSKWVNRARRRAGCSSKRNSATCLVFILSYEAIAEGQGLGDHSPTPALTASVFEGMDKVYASKVGRVVASSWFAWVRALQKFRPYSTAYWSMRLLLWNDS
eukprot:2715998-Amphidinium_carterae.1